MNSAYVIVKDKLRGKYHIENIRKYFFRINSTAGYSCLKCLSVHCTGAFSEVICLSVEIYSEVQWKSVKGTMRNTHCTVNCSDYREDRWILNSVVEWNPKGYNERKIGECMPILIFIPANLSIKFGSLAWRDFRLP